MIDKENKKNIDENKTADNIDNTDKAENIENSENKETEKQEETKSEEIADSTNETKENNSNDINDIDGINTNENEDDSGEKNKNQKDSKDMKKDAKKLSVELKQKEEEYTTLFDKYLRITAEYDNFRKRTAKEKESIYTDAMTDVLKDVLPVLDNIERAMMFADNPEPEKILEGLKMIHAQFINSLSKIGVEEIKAIDEQFNPEHHNAVFHEEDENKPDNTVTEVLQKGYIKGDKVIRPAMVKVVN